MSTPVDRKSKDSAFYETLEQAQSIVKPVLDQCAGIARSRKLATVPGWLNRLDSWLVRMERGNKEDHRTPFFHGLPYAKIADMITSICKRSLARLQASYRTVPSFCSDYMEVEEHQAEKISGRGLFPPASKWLPEKALEVFSDKAPKQSLNRSALERSLKWLSDQVPAGSIDVDEGSIREGFRNAGTSEADSNSLNVSTNSCFPTYVKHWYHKVWDRTVSLNQRLVQRILEVRNLVWWKRALRAKSWKENICRFTATGSQRTNVGSGYKITDENSYEGHPISKLRFVCAMPKDDTIRGKPFLNRLIHVAKKYFINTDGTRMFTALTTPEQIDKNFETALQTAHKAGIIPLGTDFSGYDASIAPWLFWQVAVAISHWMTQRASNIFLGLVYSAIYETECILTDRIIPAGPSSMKSGSWLTNIMDSFINLVSQRYGLEAGYYKSITHQFAQGDDGVLIGEGINPDTFQKAVADLGFTGNASKQYYKEGSVSFCQKLYVRGYPGGIYPIARATAACVSTEDDVTMETDESANYAYVLIYRTLCRLDTACFNPNFVALVELFAKDDKLHLGRSIPADKVAKLAGSYATRMAQESLDKPWKSHGEVNAKRGFGAFPVNRVLRGELPPPPGIALWEWVYGRKFSEVEL